MEQAQNSTPSAPVVTGIFNAGMTIGEAMQLHPRAREVFAGFHLGGCSHCAISEFETIAQVCEGYGVPAEMLISSLNSLAELEPTPAQA
jgi:hybrid cluster-associated redox disulfide protein